MLGAIRDEDGLARADIVRRSLDARFPGSFEHVKHLFGAGMDMSAVAMTRMAGMDGWMMTPAVWTPGYAALVFSM